MDSTEFIDRTRRVLELAGTRFSGFSDKTRYHKIWMMRTDERLKNRDSHLEERLEERNAVKPLIHEIP